MHDIDDDELRELLQRLRRFALWLTRNPASADDLVQATLERALDGRAGPRTDGSLRAWLFAILYRKFLDGQRRAALCADPRVLRRGAGRSPSTEELVMAQSTLEAFARLPAEQRALLVLVSVEGLSYKEAAVALDVPIGTVMSRLSRARKALRELAEGEIANPATDTQMNRLEPSENDLHAYLDGQLDAGQRAWVEAWLASDPEACARVEAWRRDAQQLRAGLANLEARPANPALDPLAIRRSLRARRRQRLATAAALVLALGFGGLGGWQARDRTLLAENPPMQDALEAHRLFATGQAGVVDVAARDPGQLQAWLDQRFSHASRIPDLAPYGFHPWADAC